MDKNIKIVVGAGYGDEGKGLMTDYFCHKASLNGGRILNIKVNGGAQAGHTVCKLDKNVYKHHVFRQYGSGTFSGADTYLLDTFMINVVELFNEREFLRQVYGVENKFFIDRRCRVTLPMDILMNRLIEDKRTNRHGSCGLGIYETFHRNNEIEYLTISDVIQEYISLTISDFRNKLLERAKNYYKLRFNNIFEKEGIEITEDEYEELIENTDKMNIEFMKNLSYIGSSSEIMLVDSLEDLINKYNYNEIVFECSQGLELDQFNKRNWPHLTPSNTGLLNIINEFNRNKYLKEYETEVCFVTRSYKTKHGAGEFIEQDNEIQAEFNLYDRTNSINKYQGSLRFGVLNIGRMKRLIVEQLKYIENIDDIRVALAVTHLDQTNGLILCGSERLEYKEIQERFKGITERYYYSFGEKYSDIID